MHQLNYGLENKVFVVTGGSRGIGFIIAQLLLAQKAKVVICGRKQEGLDSAAEKFQAGNQLLTVQTHVAKDEDVEKLFDQTLKHFGHLDGLINNVGMNIITNVVDADPGLWNKIIDSNLNSHFLCSRKAGQIMRCPAERENSEHLFDCRQKIRSRYGNLWHCQGRNRNVNQGAGTGTRPLQRPGKCRRPVYGPNNIQ